MSHTKNQLAAFCAINRLENDYLAPLDAQGEITKAVQALRDAVSQHGGPFASESKEQSE